MWWLKYDSPVANQLAHPYLFAGNYNAEFAVINKGNPEEKSICTIAIDVIARTCGNNVQDSGEECGEPGLTCTDGDICNPYSCQCQNSCEEVINQITEECDDGWVCSDNPAQGCNFYDATVCGSAYATCIDWFCSNNWTIACPFTWMDNCADWSTCEAQLWDWCDQFCQVEYCGDGSRDIDWINNIYGDADDEACDDGEYEVDLNGGNNQWNNNDTCTNRCQAPGCGDGNIQPQFGETCDRWSRCDDWNSATPTNCTLDPYLCPGGLVECKPRNWPDCGSSCSLNSYCGDGNTDNSPSNSQGQVEECDDGDTIDTNGCDNNCFDSTCGDGIFQNPNKAGTAEECEFNGTDWVDGTGAVVDCVAPIDENDPLGCKLVDGEPDGRCQLNPHLNESDLVIIGQVMTNLSEGDLCFNSDITLPDLQYVNPDNLPEFAGAIPAADRYSLSDTAPNAVVVYDASIKTYRWECQGTTTATECTAWVCGDGIVDGWVDLNGAWVNVLNSEKWETCDDGNKNNGDGCDEFCQLEEIVTDVEWYSWSCIDNGEEAYGRLPVVQNDEYLPIWWELDDSQHVNWISDSCVNPEDKWVVGQDMECTFGIYNKDGRIAERKGLCYNGIYSRQTSAWLTPTYNVNPNFDGMNLMEDALKDFGYDTSIPVELERRENIMWIAFEDMSDHSSSNVFGQYKIKLEKINYQYCGSVRDLNQEFAEGSTPDYLSTPMITHGTFAPEESICEMKFWVTQGYFVQRGAGISEEASQSPTTFTNIDWNDLITTSTPLDATENNVVEFAGEGKQYLTDGFIAYWEGLAIQEVDGMTNDGKARTVFKVPNQRIYLIEESNPAYPIVMQEGAMDSIIDDITIPYTIIVKGTDVIFKWSVSWNGLYVVERDIIFDANEAWSGCDDTEEVEGIFITNGMFKTWVRNPWGNYVAIRNNNLNKSQWCTGGNMVIKWLLIGEREEWFTEKRRSVLDAWKTSANLFTDENQFTMWEDQLKKLALFENCYRPLLEHNFSVELCSIAEASVTVVPEICWDGIDNDFDDAIDCADIDCSTDISCQSAESSFETCTDGIDNLGITWDWNWLVDCADPACLGVVNPNNWYVLCANPFIAGEREGTVPGSCSDWVDNDTNRLIDCADSWCYSDPACSWADEPTCGTIVSGWNWDMSVCWTWAICETSDACKFWYASEKEDQSGECSDWANNDNDRYIDCADPQCNNSNPEASHCEYNPGTPWIWETYCTDWYDNDGDGAIDCADPECNCSDALPEICDSQSDEDQDGYISCGDSDCLTSTECLDTVWWSGWGESQDCNVDYDTDGDLLWGDYDPDCGSVFGECEYTDADQRPSPFKSDYSVDTSIPWSEACVSDVLSLSWTAWVLPAPHIYPWGTNIYWWDVGTFNATLNNIRDTFINVEGTANWFISNIFAIYNPDLVNLTSMGTAIELWFSHPFYGWLNGITHPEIAFDEELIEQRTDEIVQGASFVVEIDPNIWTLNPPGADEFLQDMQVFK